MSSRKLLSTTALALLSLAAFNVAAAAAQERPQTPPPAQQEDEEPDAETAVEEVVVTSQRSDVVAAADRMSYNVANDLQRTSGSVADVLRNVPGVEVDLQGNVSLRGDPNVTILIDGRPSGMLRGGSRADALQAMSGSQIERVEVITNPSAAFSPEGSGGIINLVTKQQRPSAQSATLRGQWDGDARGGVSVSGSRTGNGLTLSGDLGYRADRREIETEQLRTRPGATPAATVVETGENSGANEVEMANARLSADYDLNARDRISGEISWRDISADNLGLETFERADGTGAVSDLYVRASDTEFGNSGMSARASWRRKFSGDQHELVADLEFDTVDSARTVDAASDTLIGGGSDYFEHIETDNSRDAQGLKVDYTRPMGERRVLKIGYEGDFSQDDFDFFGARGATPTTLTPVAALTNRFEYDQSIHAAYVTYDRPFGDAFTMQAGLRVEQVDFRLNQITDGIVVERDYLRAYPTLHLGYELTETQRLRGSYSRRIQRPGPQDLNPYTIYIDPQNIRRGNPDLDPEITDSFELAWQLRSGTTFYSVTAFYRTSEGGVTDVAQDLGGGVVLTTRENLGENERTGVEFLANGRLGDQITYNVSGSVVRSDIFVPGLAGGGQSGTTVSTRASINWTPTPNDFFQLNGFYIGDQIQAQGVREPFGTLNLGYRHKFSDTLSLTLTGANILDSAEQRSRIDTPVFQDRTFVRFGEPTYFIGFTWSLGANPNRRQEPAFDFGTQGPG